MTTLPSQQLIAYIHPAFYALHNGTTGFRIFPALDADQSAFGPLSIDEVEFFEVEDEDDSRSADPAEDFEVDSGVRPEFWNPNWIPFAAPQDRGDYLMLDFAPARGGLRAGSRSDVPAVGSGRNARDGLPTGGSGSV